MSDPQPERTVPLDEDPEVLRALVEVTGAARSPADFHDTLVRHLAEVLHAHAVLIVEMDSDGETMRTRAACIGGELVPSFTYPLAATPCETVTSAEVCVYPDDVAAQFPEDAILAEWGIRAYAGAALHDSTGRPNGVLAVLSRDPITAPAQVNRLLSAFAHRTAAEIEREQAQHQLALTEARLRAAFNTDVLGVAVLDPDGLVEANDRLCALLGFTRAELMGTTWEDRTHPDDLEVSREVYTALICGDRDQAELRKRFIRKDGSVLHGRARITVQRHPDGRPRLLTAFLEDLTAQVEAAAALERISHTDPVTGLGNRAAFIHRLEDALANAEGCDGPLAVLMVDVDHFSDVNAAWGTTIGDQLLAQVGARLTALASPEDTVARVGNDEFALLRCQAGSADAAVDAAARLVVQMQAPFTLSVGELSTTASVGVTISSRRDDPAEAILERASRATHDAMRTRNTWSMHTSELDEAARTRIELGNELGVALARGDELHVAFQPIVDLQTGRVVFAEALARWQHPTRGPVSPGIFVPIAEDRGLIEPLTHLVLGTALDHVAAWRRHDPAVQVTVNVSALDFRAPGFVGRITAALGARGLPGDCLVLELTETVLDRDPDQTAALMAALAARGVSFALDDFGTGFSSLRTLKRLPFRILKVAQEFVRDMETSRDSREIVRAVTSMGQALGLDIIAEGIETEADSARLRSLGCHVHQGYLHHRPGPADRVEALVRR